MTQKHHNSLCPQLSRYYEEACECVHVESTDVVQKTEGSMTDLINVGIVYNTESSISYCVPYFIYVGIGKTF